MSAEIEIAYFRHRQFGNAGREWASVYWWDNSPPDNSEWHGDAELGKVDRSDLRYLVRFKAISDMDFLEGGLHSIDFWWDDFREILA